MQWILFLVMMMTASAEDLFEESVQPIPQIDPALILAALFPLQNPLIPKLESDLHKSSLSYVSPLPLRGRSTFKYIQSPSDLESNELSSSLPSQYLPLLPSDITPAEDYLAAAKRRRTRSLEESIRVQFPTEHMYRLDDGTLVITEETPVSGSFKFSFQSPNGISMSEVRELKRISPGYDPIVVVRGSYSYRSPEGHRVAVQYRADENGFSSRNV